MISDERKSTLDLGPGAGVKKGTRDTVLAALKAEKSCVLDADALSVFQAEPKFLFKAVQKARDVVLTPHGGEFARLFPDLAKKQGRAGQAGNHPQGRQACRGGDFVQRPRHRGGGPRWARRHYL